MRKLTFFVAFAALSLASCGTLNTLDNIGTSSSVCSRTAADEQAAIGVNLAYKGFRLAVETGVNAGFVKGQLAGQLRTINNNAFAAVQAVDVTYRTCNGDLGQAISRANGIIASGINTLNARSQ